MMDFGLPVMPLEFIFLGAVAFFAGMVDAVVGGGGLIQIPVLLSHYPQVAIPTLFGTNKLSSIAGAISGSRLLKEVSLSIFLCKCVCWTITAVVPRT